MTEKRRSILDPLRIMKKRMLLGLESYMLLLGKFRKSTLNGEIYRNNYYEREEPVERKGVMCILDGSFLHGGPTDRLRGILTVYREAKKSGKDFYIYWRHPFTLEDYLEPATFDWRLKDSEVSRSRKNSLPVVADDLTDDVSLTRIRCGLHSRKAQIHFYTNADSARGEYSHLYHELFRPSPKLKKEVEHHLQALGGEGYSVYTFRFMSLLGDFVDCGPEALPEEEAKVFMDKVKREFLRMLSGEKEDRKILVTADSSRFLNYISQADPRIYIVPGGVSNIDRSEQNPDGAWLKTFIDQQLIMHASKVVLMRTGEMYKSGFPRFAAEVGGADFIDHQF